MTSDDGQREWAARWQAAAPRLAAIRLAELRIVNVASFINAMGEAFEAARATAPVSTTSGLVEQQRLFARLAPLTELKGEAEILAELDRVRAEVMEGG